MISLFLLSFISCFTSTYLFLKYFSKYFIQPINVYIVDSNIDSSKNTPSLGGFFIIMISFIITYYCCRKVSPKLIFILIISFAFFIMGLIDDLKKIFFKNNTKGLSVKIRFMMQIILCSITILFLDKNLGYINNDSIMINYFNCNIKIGYHFYFLFRLFTMVSIINSVNISDGIDGLISVPLLANFILIYFILDNDLFQNVFKINDIVFLESVKHLIIIVSGTILAFLFFNSNPANIFMGDCGSIPLGYILSFLFILLKKETIFLLSGSFFFIEILSVVIQINYYKITKKRLFPFTPIHHTFEKIGIKKQKIVLSFWIFSIFVSILTYYLIK